MKKNGQILIVSLWILVILTILVVSVGQRVSIALRLSRYHRDKLRASCLAKTGVNRAIAILKNENTNDYDSREESWAKDGEFLSGDAVKVVFNIVDEESKVNLNTASRELILALLEERKVSPAPEIAENFYLWRGDAPDEEQVFDTLGYSAKAAKLSNCEELKLIKGMSGDNYQKLKGAVTVAGDVSVNGESVININTASPEIIMVFLRGIAKKLSIDESAAAGLAAKIEELRNSGSPFKTREEIKVTLTGSDEINLFNGFINGVVLRSNFFLIEARGNIGRIKDKIEAVYDQKEDKLIYRHES